MAGITLHVLILAAVFRPDKNAKNVLSPDKNGKKFLMPDNKQRNDDSYDSVNDYNAGNNRTEECNLDNTLIKDGKNKTNERVKTIAVTENEEPESEENTQCFQISNIANKIVPVDLMKKYLELRLFFIGSSSLSFAYHVPYIYIPDYALSIGLERTQGAFIISTIGRSTFKNLF